MSSNSILLTKSERDKKPKLKIGDSINDKYRLVKKLGVGGFGAVYEVYERTTRYRFALKIDLSQDKISSISLEIGILKLLKGKRHVVEYKDSGRFGPYKFVIMDLLGRNLDSLRRHCPDRCFTTTTAIRIGLQSLEAIKDIHDSCFVHRDIKGSNFAIGRTEMDQKNIYILDFGLVRRYRKCGQIRPPRTNPGFRGTIRYASVNTHKNLEIGRNDDLISWMYMIIEYCTGSLKWRNLDNIENVGKLKDSIRDDDLFGHMESEFKDIYHHLLSLKYESDPMYSFYADQLNKILARNHDEMAAPFDWEQGGAHYDHMNNAKSQPYKREMDGQHKEFRTPIADKEDDSDKDSDDDSSKIESE